MRKKSKLTLSRETLRNLSSGHLRAVVGGSAAETDCASDCLACATDACTQYPACEATGAYSCRCSARYCCSFTTNTE